MADLVLGRVLRKEIKIGEPIFLRNLLIFPLTDGHERSDGVAGIDDLISHRRCRIVEVDPPQIESIRIDNLSERHLLMLDGEEITGAMQNRIAAASCLVEANTSQRIPAFCVEEGRWQASKKNLDFFSGNSLSYPGLRAIICGKRPSGAETKNRQRAVWQEITRKLLNTRVSSQTSSMHDIYEKLDDEVNRYLEDARGLEGAQGLMAAASDRFLALDLFGTTTLFEIFKEKLLKSYALEALEYRNQPTSLHHDLPSKTIEILNKTKLRGAPTVGLGRGYHFSSRGLVGKILLLPDALAADRKLLHLCLFPVN